MSLKNEQYGYKNRTEESMLASCEKSPYGSAWY
jgi:hypothetical protein